MFYSNNKYLIRNDNNSTSTYTVWLKQKWFRINVPGKIPHRVKSYHIKHPKKYMSTETRAFIREKSSTNLPKMEKATLGFHIPTI